MDQISSNIATFLGCPTPFLGIMPFMALIMSVLMFVSENHKGQRFQFFDAVKGFVSGTLGGLAVILIFGTQPHSGRIVVGVFTACFGAFVLFLVPKEQDGANNS